jgi:hypothetical protein
MGLWIQSGHSSDPADLGRRRALAADRPALARYWERGLWLLGDEKQE